MRLSRRNFLLLSGLSPASIIGLHAQPGPSSSSSPDRQIIKADRDAWIELNLRNMEWNLKNIRKKTGVPIMGVIKANAYGHGLTETGRFLDEKGVDSLMVCKLQEAVVLREASVHCPIHNFGPFSPKDAKILIHYDISQSVFSEDAISLDRQAIELGKRAKIHIHVDTGMGRMGIPYHEALPYIEKVSRWQGFRIEGISTTLTEEDFSLEQLKRFLAVCREAENKGISLGLRHAASSSAIFSNENSYLDMVRPGLALYGLYPSGHSRQNGGFTVKPVLQFKSRVAAVKSLRPGDSVGYEREFIAKKKERIAVIPVGSTDGYPYNVVGKASVLIRERRFPLISAVTFNHIEVLLNPDSPVHPGDEVVLIGNQGDEAITADEVAEWAGISAYKVLAFLNPLLPKVMI